MIRTHLLAAALFSAAPFLSWAERPNIVYIMCDDLGYGDIHCLAPETSKIATPCADKLASEGMTFTDAHSGSSVCSPTRYGLMTGRYSWRTRLQRGVVTGFAPSLIAKDRPTVASFLKAQGYHTAVIGKWHLDFQYLDPETGERIQPEEPQVAAGRGEDPGRPGAPGLRLLPRLPPRPRHGGRDRERRGHRPRRHHQHAAATDPQVRGVHRLAGRARRSRSSSTCRSARRTPRSFPRSPGRGRARSGATGTS